MLAPAQLGALIRIEADLVDAIEDRIEREWRHDPVRARVLELALGAGDFVVPRTLERTGERDPVGM